MKTVTIHDKEFNVPENCYHVAIDFDGKIYAYETQPIRGNNVAGCWMTGCHWENQV